MSILSWVSLALVGYVAVSFLWYLKAGLWVKVGLLVFFVLISQKFTFYALFGGQMFNPDLPKNLLVFGESLYNILLVLVPILVLKDAGFWLMKLAAAVSGKPLGWIFSTDAAKWAILAFATVGGIYGTYAALKVPDVRHVEIRLERLDPAFDGYRIVQMADLHVGQLIRRPWLEVVVNKANSLKPDLILLTGDMIEGSVSELSKEVKAYGKLRAEDGVFGVTGNHEYYHGHEAWIQYFENHGIEMLENRHHVVSRGDANLIIAGTRDRSAARFGAADGPNLVAALKGAPEGAVILMAHQPKGAKELQGVDLQLSGHTHGGLYLLLQPLIAYFNDGFVDGLYRATSRAQIYVSPGTGLWTGMSLRLGVPSEITEITLRSAR
ncbi:MAG TPA: metallophosphoesterase [Candidatus Aphodousia gallistercoris]|nr:metallophosphoesterase [Candidatus Aphodousia gallistercoris]